VEQKTNHSLKSQETRSQASQWLLFSGPKVPGSESSWNFRSWEQMFQGAKVPGNESSWIFRSRERKLERKFQGARVPGSESSKERKFHGMELSLPGAKVLRSESSIIRWRLLHVLYAWRRGSFTVQQLGFHTIELSLPGAKVLWSESSCYPSTW